METPNELFTIRRVGEWVESAKSKPAPRMIFDRFWLEGELAILFAATGKGKSVLGVQLAESIARGREIEPFRMELPAQKVLYFDLELSDKQFETRYICDRGESLAKGRKKHYQFSSDFLRAETLGLDEFPKERFKTFGEYFCDMLRSAVEQTGAKVIIIDDLAVLRRGRRDRTQEQVLLLRSLRKLKELHGLSVLVLARTPSRLNINGAVSLAELENSSELSGFADNIFAIGGSCADPSLRYLKHIKQRSMESDFDETNVPTFRIEKQKGNFLSFRHIDFAHEHDIVRGSRYTYDDELLSMIEQHVRQGDPQRKIAETLGISKTTVNRYLMIYRQMENERERQEEEEQERQRKRQRPLSPAQRRQQQIEEAIARNNLAFLQREAEKAARTGTAPPHIDPHPEPLTPCSAFARPSAGDDKCDCAECLSGRPKRCLENFAAGSRSP